MSVIWEKHDIFHRYAVIGQIGAVKKLDVTNIVTKGGTPRRHMDLSLNNLFLSSSKPSLP